MADAKKTSSARQEPPRPERRYKGPPPTRLYFDRWCRCSGTRYENEIVVPKGHSLILLCPACGCITVD